MSLSSSGLIHIITLAWGSFFEKMGAVSLGKTELEQRAEGRCIHMKSLVY